MDLTHRVRVPAPLDEAWEVVNDPERIAGVLPGAVLDPVDGDTFSGTLKIKLGSSLLALSGSGRYVTRDRGARRVVVSTTAADRRGDAAVEATHTLTLARAPEGAAETDVTVATSMTWTGRPNRLGDGVVSDAVDRVLEQTGTRIAVRVAEGLPWVPAPGEGSARGVWRASSVVDHPVELGADLGSVDEPDPLDPARGAGAGGAAPGPLPSPSPGPAPRPPARQEYVYRPYENTAEPHLEAARTFGRVVGRRVLPYTGLAALAAFAAASVVRRVRR